MLPQVIQFIAHYGYTAIFILIFLQEIGVPNPVPNELVLVFSGYLTFAGTLFLPFVLLSAISADLMGAAILYFTFYFFGAYILSHKPKWLPVSTAKITRLSLRISKRGLSAIFLGRLTPFIRGYISVIAGLTQIKPKLYLPVAAITAILVCCIYIIAGRLLTNYWTHIANNIVKIKYSILAVVLISISMWALIRHFHRLAKNKLTKASEQ